MKRTFSALFVAFLFYAQNAESQNNSFNQSRGLHTPIKKSNKKPDKPVVDTFAITHWVKLGDDYDISISNDGRYCAYIIENEPFQSHTLIVQSLNDSWKKEFVGANPVFFSGDSKQFIFTSNDSLYFLKTGTGELFLTAGFASFKHPSVNRAGWRYTDGEWLSWQTKSNSVLVIKNLLKNIEKRFDSVSDYNFSESGKGILLKINGENDVSKTVKLIFVDLTKGEAVNVWSSENNDATLLDYSIDASGTRVAFRTEETRDDRSSNAIWFYCNGLKKSVMIANKHAGKDSIFFFDDPVEFIGNGKYIKINMTQDENIPKRHSDAVKVDIWSYKDEILHSAQPVNILSNSYIGVINTEDILNQRDVKINSITANGEILKLISQGDFAIVSKNLSGDRFWKKDYGKDSNWLVSLKDGSRTLLDTRNKYDLWFSPGGNYLVYFESTQKCNYFSYNLKTGKSISISADVPPYQLGYRDEFGKRSGFPETNVSLVGWINNDQGVLVYDNFDLWLLDPSGAKRSLNLTNGYGRSHEIKFRLAEGEDESSVIHDSFLLLIALNIKNKQNGFYRVNFGANCNPQKLSMSENVYSLVYPKLTSENPHDFFPSGEGMRPIKSKDANVWLVIRQSNQDAPNYYITEDFRKFRPITDLHSQKNYNWLTAELISFKQIDGTISEGVLYKPENFDPKKKYPLIFNYYEQMSHRLFEYPQPDFMDGADIDVAWFVSRGFLVFTPDIYTIKGMPGKSAFNAVMGAVEQLKSFPFIDTNKLALAGHSTGGYLTNYILVNTSRFAAVVVGAGTSDLISNGFGFSGLEGSPRKSKLERVESSLHQALWSNQKLWIESSPILKADQAAAPLLIFHCKADNTVLWEQGVELFIALRRLNKQVWMLQYDNGDHGVWSEKDREDITMRITQFFDHFLKAKAAPVWMTKGIPLNAKMLYDGLQIDKGN